MYFCASKKININDDFYSFKKRKSSNEFYSACKKERFILSFSHNFTTLRLKNAEIFFPLPSFDSAQDDMGGKISNKEIK